MSQTRPNRRWALAGIAGAVLVLQACAHELAPVGPSLSTKEDLYANRELWESRRVGDYRYTIQRSCRCEPEVTNPALVEVRDGKTASVTALDPMRPIRTQVVDSLDNFWELFDFVQAAMEQGPDKLVAEYDPEWGYPVYLFVDPRRDVEGDEHGFQVERFEPLR
ncbi:MAG TPA: DUF6174 domain-containing protein [Longimicrobiaceae bacterium]|nr:DUF6174 domain-containing protein [Longimicrobiaceae bacterium]